MLNVLNRLFIVLALCFSIFQSDMSACEQTIKQTAIEYVAYLNSFGQKKEQHHYSSIRQQLFAENCQRTINGTVCTKSKEELQKYLQKERETNGQWTLGKLSFNSVLAREIGCTIQYDWTSVKGERKIVIAILMFNSRIEIRNINEVQALYGLIPVENLNTISF